MIYNVWYTIKPILTEPNLARIIYQEQLYKYLSLAFHKKLWINRPADIRTIAKNPASYITSSTKWFYSTFVENKNLFLSKKPFYKQPKKKTHEKHQ